MAVLTAYRDIRQLPADKQKQFVDFYQEKMSAGLLPALADFNIALLIVGAIFSAFSYVSTLDKEASVLTAFHPLTYLYWSCLGLFVYLNRCTRIRQKAPLMIYITTTVLMLFSYRNFVIQDGNIDPIFGLYFYSAFIGIATASIKHTFRIQGLSLCLLALSYLVIDQTVWLESFVAMTVNWFIFHCLLMSVSTAVFSQWMFRNLYASQFMLNLKNDLLQETFKSLRETESILIQQQKYQALSHMAKGLLHEVINPINSASQALSFAQSVNEDDDVGEALEEAQLQQHRISNIVTDLRSYAQPEYESQLSSESIQDLVSLALKFSRRELEKEHVELQLELADGLLINCHASAVTQVIVNLILNAIDAMRKKGSTERLLDISIVEAAESVRLSIRDNGVGIDKAKLDKVLDPFFSEEGSPERMGLGLSICQTIMRHHAGTIEVDSVYGEWTEVVLNFPYAIEVPANTGQALSETEASEFKVREGVEPLRNNQLATSMASSRPEDKEL